MISATLRICGSFGVESTCTSSPSKLRLSDELNVAKRNVSSFLASAGEAVSANAAAAQSRVRLSMSAPYGPSTPECEESAQQHDDQDRDDDRHAQQGVGGARLPLVLPEARPRAVARVAPLGRLAGPV